MGYSINYRGVNNPRKPINDMISYVGLRRMKLLISTLKGCRTMADIDFFDMACSFTGVSGEPVRRLIAHIWGEKVLAQWLASPDGSREEIVA
jgi:hypothetical protein